MFLLIIFHNSDASSLISYANAAAAVSSNTPAKQVLGGVAALIPLANAIVPTAAASSSSTSSVTTASRATGGKSSLTTMTITRGTGGTATATAFVTVGVGGGTATQFATATVGPSGLATGAGVASPTGAGANQGGLAADGPQPQPATFTGGARSMRGKIMDALVVAGVMSLGTVLVTVRW